MMAGNKITVILAIGLTLTAFLTGCRTKSETNGESEFKAKVTGNKPIVAIIIDSLMDKTLQEAMKQGTVPG